MPGGVAARDDDPVARTERQRALGDLFGGVEQHVRGGELLAHDGNDPPGQRQLAPRCLVGRQTDDRHGGAESGDHARRHALT